MTAVFDNTYYAFIFKITAPFLRLLDTTCQTLNQCKLHHLNTNTQFSGRDVIDDEINGIHPSRLHISCAAQGM